MLFLGRMSRMKSDMHPKALLAATVDGKRSRGRQCRAARDAMVESINLVVPNVGEDGRIDRWIRMHQIESMQ